MSYAQTEALDLWIAEMEAVTDWESFRLDECSETECFYSIDTDPIAPE